MVRVCRSLIGEAAHALASVTRLCHQSSRRALPCALSDRLLRDHGLLLAASAYFAGGERHVRTGFGTAGATAGFALPEEALRA